MLDSASVVKNVHSCLCHVSVGVMDEWTVKTPNPICRLFFKIYLLTDIAALCLTDFIDWRYIHSLFGIFDPACELLPPWTKELYLCTVAPLSSLWPPPPLPKLNVQYIQTLCVWGWGVNCAAGILHSVSDQIQNLPNCFTTPNKMTSENDIRGIVQLFELGGVTSLIQSAVKFCKAGHLKIFF